MERNKHHFEAIMIGMGSLITICPFPIIYLIAKHEPELATNYIPEAMLTTIPIGVAMIIYGLVSYIKGK